MAVYRFSALSDGQSIGFNASSDVLNFDQTSIAAADIRATIEGSHLRVSVVSGPQLGKDVLLLNVAPTRLTTTNVTFADGSRLLFGDNTTGTTNDNSSNILTGTSGNDQLAGFGGSDTLNGGSGNDLYIVTSGDVIRDSGGIDTVESSIGWSLASGLENLTLTGSSNISANGNNLANVIIGNSGSNGISAREGNDTLIGNAGNDKFIMSNGGGADYGNDSIDGGSGVDTLDYGNNARTPVSIDLAAGTASGGGTGGAGSATLISVENANGGAYNDVIKGSSAANFLYGHNGNDTLDGVEGQDRLEGGGGADRYVFSVAPGSANADTIVGFVSGTDEIALDAAVHLDIGAGGDFVAGDARFVSGWGLTSGLDSADRVIYNAADGRLYYDADGSDPGASQLIGILHNRPAIRATDITVLGEGSPGGSGGGGDEGTVNGTAGNDSLKGTSGNETINGFGGNDTINGAGGSDSLDGGTGNDSIVGGVFDPQMAEGGDILVGGDGDDTLNGINHRMWAADVNVDTLDGGIGNDVFWVDNGADVLKDAGGTDDTVHAANTPWTLGADFENLVLHTDEFEFDVGIGNDHANHMRITWAGRLEGMGGNDTLVGGPGGTSDELFGGDGNDFIDGNFAGLADGGAGDDTLIGAFNMTGGAGADDFDLDFVDFITDFASGTDTLIADGNAFENVGASGRFADGDGRFRFHEAAGANEAQDADDRFIYNLTTGELHYDEDGTGPTSGFFVGRLEGAPALDETDFEVVNGTSAPPPPPPPPSSGGETITGTTANDTLVGTAGDDTIDALYGDDLVQGMGGNDSLFGAAGKDTLEGGDGNDTLRSYWWSDTLTGGAGSDSFVYTEFGTNHKDRITDFAVGTDELVFENANFSALGDAGAWAAGDGRFLTVGGTTTSGQDADDRLIYNTSTATLYYDSDGGGAATGQIVAVFTGNPTITASDITVI
jgi:Ca2+-binding RTX toxin-like protein